MSRAKRRKYGFTLIELMVVIAIIGILAVMLFPAIKTGILQAKATAMGNKGKQVVTAIIQANLEREAISYAPIWARSGNSSYAQTSTAYFKWLIEQEYLEGMDYSFFAGSGVAVPQAGTAFGAENNAWKIVAELTDSEPDTLPVLFTRNIEIDSADIKDWPASEDRIDMNVEAKPFGNTMGVIINKGAAMMKYRKQYLTWSIVYSGTNKLDYLEVWAEE